MNLIRLVIAQPVTVAVGVILILLAGMISLERLPIQLTPNVESTIITVSTYWEGASPSEVEQEIIDPQEERLLGLSGLRAMTSTSSQSTGMIRLEFETGTDKDGALRETSDRLNEVPSYPDNVDEPIIDVTDPENRDYIAWIVFGTTDPDFDIRVLRDFAVDRIEPALERVPGIAEINVLGGREREMQVRIDPIRVAQHGVTPAMLVEAVRSPNRNFSAGQRQDGKLDVRVRTVGQYTSAEDIEQTVLTYTDAGPVLIRDVADVVLTYKEPSSFVRSKGQPVIAINADREIGSNVMVVMDGLRRRIAELNAPGGLLAAEANRLGLNGTLTLTQVYDQTIYIEDALTLVRNNIWIGGALATLVLLLFLRSLRSVGIVAVAIPISVIGAVVAMVAMGRSINVVSLAGMAFAVGLVVDNAIVVLENIFRHLEMGKPPRLAAFDGTREVWGAVLASTLTTIAVFIPILLVEEEAGQLFRDIALALCAAVGLSLVISMTVIPTASARLLRARKPIGKDGSGSRSSGISVWIGRRVERLCGSIVPRLAVIVVLAGGSILGTWLLIPPTDYLPHGNRNLIFGLIIPPPGYNIEQFDRLALRIESDVQPFFEAGTLKDDREAYEAAKAALPSVPVVDWMTGATFEVVPPPIDNYFLVSFEGILFHGAVSVDPSRTVDLLPLFNHATRAENAPGTIAFPFQAPLFQLGGSTGSAVKLNLAGPDLDEITTAAEAVYMSLAQRFGFQSIQPVPSNFTIEGPEIRVEPDLVRLGELGLTTSDVGMAVLTAGDGAIIDDYHIGGEAIDLKIIAADAIGRSEINDLIDLPVAGPTGRIVPLSAVARVQRTTSPQEIARVGRQRAVSFQVTAPESMPLEALIGEIETTIDEFRAQGVIPSSIDATLSGSASKLASVREALLGDGTLTGTLGSSLVLALVVVYLLMCVLYQSFAKPLVIMFTVPLATCGGFAALAVVSLWSFMDRYAPIQKLDVLTMLGFILLIGVVVNNAILIVHQTLNFLTGRADAADPDLPMTPQRAIGEAVRTRVRPIFMGMLTSVGGMLPLVLMPGAGSELYRGLGSVVVGGLAISTIFTILLVPLVLSLLFDVQGWLARTPEAAPAPARASAGPEAAPSGSMRRSAR